MSSHDETGVADLKGMKPSRPELLIPRPERYLRSRAAACTRATTSTTGSGAVSSCRDCLHSTWCNYASHVRSRNAPTRRRLGRATLLMPGSKTRLGASIEVQARPRVGEALRDPKAWILCSVAAKRRWRRGGTTRWERRAHRGFG
eukprot:scaffold132535_cov81-Phaeocystis_antarctica.AAC.1